MVRFENECVGCRSMGMPCFGPSCPNRDVPHLYCDDCGDEAELYEFDGLELCIGCVVNRLEKVDVSNR